MVGIQYDCAPKTRSNKPSRMAQALDWAAEVGKLICIMTTLVLIGFTAFLAMMSKV